jgi:hypothetical protein
MLCVIVIRHLSSFSCGLPSASRPTDRVRRRRRSQMRALEPVRVLAPSLHLHATSGLWCRARRSAHLPRRRAERRSCRRPCTRRRPACARSRASTRQVCARRAFRRWRAATPPRTRSDTGTSSDRFEVVDEHRGFRRSCGTGHVDPALEVLGAEDVDGVHVAHCPPGDGRTRRAFAIASLKANQKPFRIALTAATEIGKLTRHARESEPQVTVARPCDVGGRRPAGDEPRGQR